MELRRSGALYYVSLNGKPMIFHQRPATGVLFKSVVKYVGEDCAQWLLDMKNAGARIVAQDEKTSVVFGMSKETISLGAAYCIKPIQEVKNTLWDCCFD